MHKLFILSLAVALSAWSCTFLVDFEEEAGTPEDCTNFMDDDGDGYVDCNDQDCQDRPDCQFKFEICDNQLDDDENGYVDCEDPACSMQEVCWQEAPLCNDVISDGQIAMYSMVYSDTPTMCEEWLECRIDRYGSDGVPRCVRTGPVAGMFEPCNNDLECPYGFICAWSEVLSFGEGGVPRDVCLPLCSNLLNIGCPETLMCFNLISVYDPYQASGQSEVTVTACDRPYCAVLDNLGLGTGCDGQEAACYPAPDMMGQAYCEPKGNGGPRAPCSTNSDCLPRHVCLEGFDGDARMCQRVCQTSDDCGIGTVIECVKRPEWTTYGVCADAFTD